METNNIQSSGPESGLLTTNKFKSFPVVNSTCYWLSESYSKIKETNFVTKCTIGIAESTLKNSMYLATPIVNKFKDQVTNLDSMAFNQLERLETAFPIIKSDTGDLYSRSKNLIHKTVEPVSTRYRSLKTNTKNKCSSVKSCITYTSFQGQSIANRVLDMSQSFIEQYLIYTDLHKLRNKEEVDEFIKYYGEFKLNEKRCRSLVKRLRVLTYVFFFALKANMINQVKFIYRLITDRIAKLYTCLDCLSVWKKSLVNKTKDKFYLTRDKIDLYKEYLDVLSKQFTVQDGRSLNHVQSLEDRTKIIIRRSLGNLIAAFHLVYSRIYNVIPLVQTRFKLMGQCVDDLYQIYNKHDGSFNEILVEMILSEISMISYKIQCSTNVLIKKMNQSAMVSWFVPNFETFGVLDYDFEEFAINKPGTELEGKAVVGESSEEELTNAFSLELNYSSEFSHPVFW